MNEHLRWPEGTAKAATTEQVPQPSDAEHFTGVGDPGALEAFFGEAASPSSNVRALLPRSSPGGGSEIALTEAYRQRGFIRARLDPLSLAEPPPVSELDPQRYGMERARSAPLIDRLDSIYCGTIGWEIGHIHDTERRQWLETQAESPSAETLDTLTRLAMLSLLMRATAFESGLNLRIPGGKLFGLTAPRRFSLLSTQFSPRAPTSASKRW